jgi:hypothetical protein
MDYMKFRFKKFTYEIYHRPGEWMMPEALEGLQKRLVAVAEARLGSRPNFGFFVDRKSFGNKLITICSLNGEDRCFNAMAYIGHHKKRPVVHLGAVYSLEGNKGQMQLLYYWSCLYMFYHAGFRRVYITSLTHTPKIFGAVAEAYEQVFPNGEPNARPEPFHLAIRDMLMETYLKEFQMRVPPVVDERFIIKGFRLMADGTTLYPDTTDTVPKHRKSAYNRHCLDNIDYPGGDDIMQVGFIRLTTPFKNTRLFKKGGALRLSNIAGNLFGYGRECAGGILSGHPKTACGWNNVIMSFLRR